MANPNDIDVQGAIKELDKVLHKKGLQYTLYTCGGAALIFLGHDNRGTGDVDIILSKMDHHLKNAVEEVSKSLRISGDWLNNKVTPLGERLGKGWKKKCIKIYEGRSVTLMSISRQDLISSKLHAAVDRRSIDFFDIIWLSPTNKELEKAREYVIKQGETETYHVFVDAYIRRIREELGSK